MHEKEQEINLSPNNGMKLNSAAKKLKAVRLKQFRMQK
jgi:hypothetical protein